MAIFLLKYVHISLDFRTYVWYIIVTGTKGARQKMETELAGWSSVTTTIIRGPSQKHKGGYNNEMEPEKHHAAGVADLPGK